MAKGKSSRVCKRNAKQRGMEVTEMGCGGSGHDGGGLEKHVAEDVAELRTIQFSCRRPPALSQAEEDPQVPPSWPPPVACALSLLVSVVSSEMRAEI